MGFDDEECEEQETEEVVVYACDQYPNHPLCRGDGFSGQPYWGVRDGGHTPDPYTPPEAPGDERDDDKEDEEGEGKTRAQIEACIIKETAKAVSEKALCEVGAWAVFATDGDEAKRDKKLQECEDKFLIKVTDLMYTCGILK